MAKLDCKITEGGLKVWEHPKGSGIKIRERSNPDGAILDCVHHHAQTSYVD